MSPSEVQTNREVKKGRMAENIGEKLGQLRTHIHFAHYIFHKSYLTLHLQSTNNFHIISKPLAIKQVVEYPQRYRVGTKPQIKRNSRPLIHSSPAPRGG